MSAKLQQIQRDTAYNKDNNMVDFKQHFPHETDLSTEHLN